MTNNARVRSVAYIGWRGIRGCEVLDLSQGPITALLGQSGAGKTTMAMCLAYALLPDKRVLEIQPISEVKDVGSSGADMLAGKIDPRCQYAYVVLDIATRLGKRLVAGVFVDKIDERSDFTRWLIRNAPEEFTLKDLMAVKEDDEYVTYPALVELRRELAIRGIDVEVCKNVGDYGQALNEAGILPSSMRSSTDRSLFANLIKTTFKGGLSNEVVGRLKEYLLTSQHNVPEIVRGLQECADEIIRTKNAIASADKELTLLKSTYGAGREIVATSLRWLLEEKKAVEEFYLAAEKRLSDETKKKSALDALYVETEQEIVKVRQEKEEARRNACVNLEAANKKYRELADEKSQILEKVRVAKDAKGKFDDGKKSWLQIVKEYPMADSFDDARQWIDAYIKNLQEKEFGLKKELEIIREEILRLESGQSSDASELLAAKLGGESLEKALWSLEEKEAVAVELSLCGLTDGVVGIDKKTLLDLPATSDLPATFWLGGASPESQKVEEIGEWLICNASGGHVVAKKDRQPIFGGEARKKRCRDLHLVIDKKKGALTQLSKDIERFTNQNDGLRTLFDQNSKNIHFYLGNCHSVDIEESVGVAKEALAQYHEKLTQTENDAKSAGEILNKIEKPFDDALKKLSYKKELQKEEIQKLKDEIEGINKRLTENSQKLETLRDEHGQATDVLGVEFALMVGFSQAIKDFSQDDILADLSDKIAGLRGALIAEVPERADFFQSVKAKDRISTIELWPILRQILRERISIDLADSDGLDLIQAARDRRAELDSELADHEKAAKANARNIGLTIRSAISSSRQKIDKLSRLGEDIRFGNVEGIRLRLTEKKEMLNTLQSFSDQLNLFSKNKPVDVAIKEWFDNNGGWAESHQFFSGADLLDYRNYVDLAIEARRTGQEWGLASSLSGGESIGSGLALALMLMRSIAARGEGKPEQITPLFILDEVHRLDDAGVAVIVNFAKRENFQVVVTAQKIEPSYDCTLYTLTRVYTPDDQLIIRGIQVSPGKVAA